MTVGEIIKDFRSKYNVTMDDFAQMAGICKGYVSMLEKNENPRTKKPITPTTKTLKGVATALGISVSALMDKMNQSDDTEVHHYPSERTVIIPVIGTVRAGVGGLALEDNMGYETVDAHMLYGYDVADFFYLTVKGDSMVPRLYEDDLVLVRKQSNIDSGSYGIVTIDDEEGVVKIVQHNKNSVTLISQNHNYPPRVFEGKNMKRIKIIGKVIESKSKFK